MAGFVDSKNEGRYWFNIGVEKLSEQIREVTDHARVITLQLDGDELDAALWGLDNYKKTPVVR